MTIEAYNRLLEVLFVGSSVSLALWGLVRKAPRARERNPSAGCVEVILTAAMVVLVAVAPAILVLGTLPVMPGIALLGKWVLLPCILLMAILGSAAKSWGMQRLSDRILVGLWAGAAASGFLDAIRILGLHLGFMPWDLPRLFGMMFTDRLALGPSHLSDLLGQFFHYWIGCCLGLAYTLSSGRFHWRGGLLWALLLEVGVAMGMGCLGCALNLGLLATSLTAHAAFGAMLGLLCAKNARQAASLFHLVLSLKRGVMRTDPAVIP